MSYSSRRDSPHEIDRRDVPRRDNDRRLLRRERELEAAKQISLALFKHLDLDDLIKQALQTALDIVQAESGSILLAVPETKELVFRHSIGESHVKAGTAIPWDQGIAGTVFRTGAPLVIGDVRTDPRHFHGIDTLTQHTTRDMIALPLNRWEGEPIGVLEILNKHNGRLDEDDLAILTIVSGIAAVSIEQAHLFQEAKLAEVVHLLGDIGHDIKNLLMPVVCGTGLLSDELKGLYDTLPQREKDKAKTSYDMCSEVVDMVSSSTHRIQDRVKEIADCVKGLSSPPDFAPCKIGSVITSVFESLKWFADQKGVALKSVGVEALPEIVADERRLFNAFYNLVNNAIPEVSSDGSITVSGREEPPGVGIHIAVIDTGKGMPPEIRDQLFTPGAKSSKPGGTGLGTKIVKDVVDAHRGKVSVESEYGKGTTFHLYFPLNPRSVG